MKVTAAVVAEKGARFRLETLELAEPAVGSARKGVEATLEMALVQHGRTLRGCIQGDAPAEEFIPQLFEHWRNRQLRVEPLVAYYDFADINRAVEDSLSGRAVKAVLRIDGEAAGIKPQ
ncbi:MAG: hypothetical protein A3G81_18815 [Betaproteobacteria bacterium RIFCSPLOWO2_12_FULL_65_14]|nr:MAG: hypothetical protein A3G81_18815 [Betaproteobacteria bacterium RIFCSPLOWO2_12_FULL_65_14]